MKIALFASGGGSNAEVIIQTLTNYIKKETATISVVVSNNENAGVKNIAADHNVPFELLSLKNKTESEQAALYLNLLNNYKIDFVILAGFLKKLPKEITNSYPKRIVNIHPALLPSYGGAGMYGKHVHNAVIAAGEKESGITVHYIDEVYDHGQIIFQAKCAVEKNDTVEGLGKKVLALEHQYYTPVIAEILVSQFPVK